MLNWYRTVVLGYKSTTTSAAIVYGLAFHKYIDIMYQTGGNMKLAREASFELFRREKYTPSGSEHLADERHLMVTCYNYWEDVILKDQVMDVLLLPDDKPATEVTFRLPYYEDETFIVNLCGTIDRIGKIKNGCFVIPDFKTTSKYNVKEFLADFRMSKQLRFYSLALKIMAERYPESVLGQVGATTVGTRIDGVFLKAKASDNIYASSSVFMFKNETLVEFRRILDDQIQRLLWHIRSNYFPKEGINNGTCKGEYRCAFWGVCAAPDEMQEVLLQRDFQKVHYDPLSFNKPLVRNTLCLPSTV